ncbi:MAG: 2TM domain-containing protein [Rubrivivax sp.]|nr:2TM domain-containing protein [Rubrivivax sp.]
MSRHDEDPLQRRARRRVEMKLGWAVHALVFVLVNLGLATINYLGGGHRWHLWPLGWWGLGLAIHGAVVAVGIYGDGMRERMVADEVERLRERERSQGPGR